jgi:catalase
VNRALAEVRNNQRDGYSQHKVYQGRSSYFPNSLSDNQPEVVEGAADAFSHYQERVDGVKVRRRSESFKDFYSQATLFWNSMSTWEREHIVAAYRFELGKVEHPHIRERTVRELDNIDHGLAVQVAAGIGVQPPSEPARPNHGRSSPALSLANSPRDSIKGRKVAILAADGVDANLVQRLKDVLQQRGALGEVVAPELGTVRGAAGEAVLVDRAVVTMSSVLYDAVFVPGGKESVDTLAADGESVHYVSEAFKHGKAIGAADDGVDLLRRAPVAGVRLNGGSDGVVDDRGVVTAASQNGDPSDRLISAFTEAIAKHRNWDREADAVPA